jgi:hypothetical protein
MESFYLLWGLAVIESGNSSDPQVKWVLDAEFFFEEGSKSLSLFLAALRSLFLTFAKNGEYLLIKSCLSKIQKFLPDHPLIAQNNF